MYRPAFFALVIFLAAPFPSYAQTSPQASRGNSAEQMLSACKSISKASVFGKRVKFPQTFESGYCWGSFTTIQEVIVNVDSRGNPVYGVCAPPSSTLTQLIRIFVRYAKQHPADLNENYFYVALHALRKAFPCHRHETHPPQGTGADGS